jgi:hypothetical protein
MLKFFCATLLTALTGFYGNAQNIPGAIGTADGLFSRYATTDTALRHGTFFVVSTNGADCKGLPVVRSLGNHVFIINTKDIADFALRFPCIGRSAPAHPYWKLSPDMELANAAGELAEGPKARYVVSATDINALLNSAMVRQGAVEVVSVFAESQSAVVACAPAFLFGTLLRSDLLIFVDKAQRPQTEVLLTGYDKSNNQINAAAFQMPFANGKGIVVGVKERSMDNGDIDLQRRVQPSVLAVPEVEFHATSIATMIGGAGNSFYTGRGIAPQCRFFPSSFNNLFPDSTALLLQQQVHIQNHSYGIAKQQFYGAEAAAYDVQTYANKNLLHVFSSGNRGTEGGAAGPYNNIPGFANMTGNFKMAKNLVTVAALDTTNQVAPFSSAGPLHDGRLGPQLTAFGLNGTSDAAALVSGTAAVLHQLYKDSNAQQTPPSALIRALLFNTADDVAAPGIDYRTGFGSVNVRSAILAMLKKQYDGSDLQQGGTWVRNFTVPNQAANLKATLVWTDTAAGVNANTVLANDLDLELVELSSGTVYRPWVLNPYPHVDSLTLLPVRKRDSLNTAEQISIALPAGGQFQLRVKGARVQTQQPQPFSIAWGWDTLNRFEFTNPLQAEDISLAERGLLVIKWKTALADGNTPGNLSVSFNNGATWQPIASGIPLGRQRHQWAVKDTVAVARLKMDTPFGSFLSGSFVIAPFTNIKTEYRCPDSAGIAWQRHPMAVGYQVFALPTDTPYLKPIMTVADTLAVFKGAMLQYRVFAVRPLLGNGLPAAQSTAVDINNQAVNCFYTSFQAFNNWASVALQLQLSTTRGVDSVVVEKLGKNGAVPLVLLRAKATAQQLDYAAADGAPWAGVNTYRGRIVFANGGIVYTEQVSLINTGPRQIFFYPNPVSAGGQLGYQLNDGSPGWQLQLVDMQGRVVRNQSIGFAGTLRLAGIQAGIYFYRLYNSENVLKETGKIIVNN